MSSARDVELVCADGATLHATCHDAHNARGVVVIAPAMAVPERLYTPLAVFLADNGYTSLTFDYRGIGRSANIDEYELSFRAWGEQDIGAAVRKARELVPAGPCTVIGHSAGGQLTGMCDATRHIDAFVMVAAGSAHWRLWQGIQRLGLFTVWYVVIPVLGRLLRRIPGRLLGSSEGVPSTIARDWAHCARDPRYVRGARRRRSDVRYESFAPATLVWTISDDHYAPAAATESLLTLYPALSAKRRRVEPGELKRNRLGHFGWFRSYAEPLWRETIIWLDALPGRPTAPSTQI